MERLEIDKPPLAAAKGIARVKRAKLPFRSVNRRGFPGYRKGMQRHHLLPCQLLKQSAFKAMFQHIGHQWIGFDDFRRNGLLLPATEDSSIALGMPLHRGPHRRYNEMVAERAGQIEAGWARARLISSERAASQMLMRFDLLQRALRRRLLDQRYDRFPLSTRDPLGQGIDFSELDAMAEALWADTAGIFARNQAAC